MRVYYLFLLSIFVFVSNCNKKGKEERENIEAKPSHLFEKLDSNVTNVSFENNFNETLYFNFINYSYIYNGGGVAVGDINNDGLEDIYFSSNEGANKLYVNKGNFNFEDITVSAGVIDNEGWSTGVSMIDINNDGWLDIYVCKSGVPLNNELRRNKLFINKRNGSFVEMSKEFGLDSPAFSTQAYYFDFDKDGDLDVYLVNHRADFQNNVYIDERIKRQIDPLMSDQLFENVGMKFIDISKKANISNKAWGLSASIGDFNEDGWEDIYVANDFLDADFLYINNGDGTFKNEVNSVFEHITTNSMGSDFADVNNDDRLDLVVVDMVSSDHKRSKENMATMSTANFLKMVDNGYHYQYMSNMLQINQGKGVYSEIGQLSGIAKTDWSWAPLLADFDNDGLKDLIVTNGIYHDLSNQDFRNRMKQNIMNRKKVTLEEAIAMMPSSKIPNQVFRNTDGYTFNQVNELWGITENVNSNGIAYADFDNDGDLDLVINNQKEIASIYKNNQKNNFVGLTLKGNKNNKNAIGAKVKLFSKDQSQVQYVYPCRGFQSSVTNRVYFGLGKENLIDSLVVTWSSGKSAVIKDVKINEFLLVDENKDARSLEKQINSEFNLKLMESSEFGIDFIQQEVKFNDYKRQLLLPQKQSEKGRALCVGDVNNDKRDDFFVGNGKGKSGKLYLQLESGKFIESSSAEFLKDALYEDASATFIDIDLDGDLDLYVGSGSYEDDLESDYLKDRVYINNGLGKFLKSEKYSSDLKMVSSVVKVCDYDKDGDSDLFVGGGVIPGQYPSAYPSKLFKNDNGLLVDQTEEVLKDFKELKMVNDAVFSDIDGDGDDDLLIVGEWMPICIFKNTEDGFEKIENPELENTDGWYFSIYATDIDSNGTTDYLIGNLGMNNKYHPSSARPLHVYAKDFDQNNNVDVVLSKESKEGVLLPVRGKECSSEQLPVLNSKFKTYKQFANADLSDIYGDLGLDKSIHFKVHNFGSLLLKNNGSLNFTLKQLPIQAQFGPTNAFITIDDNKLEKQILGAGSLYEAEVETVRYDSNKGYVLNYLNNGLNAKSLNIFDELEVKSMSPIIIGDKKYTIVLCKDSKLKFLKS